MYGICQTSVVRFNMLGSIRGDEKSLEQGKQGLLIEDMAMYESK